MIRLFRSSLLLSANLSFVHDTVVYDVVSITQIIIITICVYCNLRGYKYCKYCHEADNQFLKPYNPIKIWGGWGHKHNRNVYRFI